VIGYSKYYLATFSSTESPSNKGSDDSNKAAAQPNSWLHLSENPRTAVSILKEIVDDNRTKLSAAVSLTVQEKFFEVELDHDLVKMRSDTRLVLVDVPGLNEAWATFEQYKAHVSDQWRNFDCRRACHGRQTWRHGDHVFLLRFVTTMLATKKLLPLIVLCNKADDEEQAKMLNEAPAYEIVNDAGVSDRKDALDVGGIAGK
jgi:hypothetical protein